MTEVTCYLSQKLAQVPVPFPELCKTGVHGNASALEPSLSPPGGPEVYLQGFWLWEGGCSTPGCLSVEPAQVK